MTIIPTSSAPDASDDQLLTIAQVAYRLNVEVRHIRRTVPEFFEETRVLARDRPSARVDSSARGWRSRARGLAAPVPSHFGHLGRERQMLRVGS